MTTHQFIGNGATGWLSILQPTALCSLDIPLSNERLVTQIRIGDPFACVTELKIVVDHRTLYSLQILPKFPATEILNIRDHLMDFESRWPFAIPTATEKQVVEAIPLGLPRLREYTGPYKLLPLFFPILTLRRVTVLRCNLTHFLGRLHALRPSTTVRSLDLQINTFDMKKLRLLFDFVQLHLVITSQTFSPVLGHELEAFSRELASCSPLPASMEQLDIVWRLASPFRHDALDLPALKASLFAEHPALRFEVSRSPVQELSELSMAMYRPLT